MSRLFWQAKIWGLLHDPALKALRHSRDFSDEGPWQQLACMEGWVSPKAVTTHKETQFNGEWLKHVGRCDLLASASDRSTIGRMPPEHSAVTYGEQGLEITHLLSGVSSKPHFLEVAPWRQRLLQGGRQAFLKKQEEAVIPEAIRTCTDPRKVFWWFWRCYPALLSQAIPELDLLPAETRLPDGSLWSHTSVTAALAGSLAGYYKEMQDYPQKGKTFKGTESRPYIASFTFTPIQELIKASRKMRDLWAGSWVLHYLSARVCWEIAWKYGPDTLIYPCLYAQPLIDHWLLEQYNDFDQWIDPPAQDETSLDALLTAGFPNVLVMVLPDNGVALDASASNPVKCGMQQAQQVLRREWKELGDKVLGWLQNKPSEWQNLSPDLWDQWLQSQWQSYWVALPLGDRSSALHHSPQKEDNFQAWTSTQNKFAMPQADLFLAPEAKFLKTIFGMTEPSETDETTDTSGIKGRVKQPNLNVGSWWASIFDQVRFSLTAVKNARTWELPTAFSSRSTISGMGPALHPVYDPQQPNRATEGQTREFWSNPMGLFDGREQLNATEVLKRGLHQVLLEVLKVPSNNNDKIRILYPDLSSGVSGWLRQLERSAQAGDESAAKKIAYYQKTCKEILGQFSWAAGVRTNATWGIPWVHRYHRDWLPPRLLNAGWLIEDYDGADSEAQQKKLVDLIKKRFSDGNNPTDWYVLAAGDGDGMQDWLKGKHLKPYEDYIPQALRQKLENLPETYASQPFRQPVQEFLRVQKRMGPATHAALSRALLDFSNQLAPYLTEQRYAGRLIYGGGDDVLAYTNLWEWDSWLWDIRQCFRGAIDPQDEFDNRGDYWRWQGQQLPDNLSARPLFTMGQKASISFGVVIANQGVPLAIALENLWEAEEEAKDHVCDELGADRCKKNAVQVRVLYGNGNILKATAKFETFDQWRQLVALAPSEREQFEPALFEQAAQVWKQHPAPEVEAIAPWVKAFCSRREALTSEDDQQKFSERLRDFLKETWQTTALKDRDDAIGNWLKLAAFVLRKREIKIPNSIAQGGEA